MDGPKPLLRHVLIASLALSGPATVAQADDFIRQPVRSHTAQTQTSASHPPASFTNSAAQNATHAAARPATKFSTAASSGSQRTAAKTVAFPLTLRSRGGDVNKSTVNKPAVIQQPTTEAIPSWSQHSSQRARTEQHTGGAAISTIHTPAKSRAELAARISNELLSDQPGQAGLIAPGSLEPGPGWQAVSEELKGHLSKCEALLARSAYLSAREEANQAILSLTRVLDLRQNKLTSEPAWAQAQQALREAQDFTNLDRIASDAELFNRLIQSHQTPALRGVNVTELTPLAAAQHYRAYAERSLVEASQGHPWFSELYYCIGRTHQAQAEAGEPQADALLQQALTYYRSAYAIHPANATNTNQLGFVLLRMDRPTEAFTRLSEAVRLPDCPLEGWQNLVQASSRIGDESTAQWAAQSYLTLKSQGKVSSEPSNTLVEVEPMQFVAMSPRTSGPRAGTGSEPSPVSATTQGQASQGQTQTSAASVRTATSPRKSFFR